MQTRKYGRTYHFPFSAGVSSDDKILYEWQQLFDKEVVMLEKLDGENACIKSSGVYARSHAAPTRHAWAGHLWETWGRIGSDLGNLEVFGENLYAVHSIEYERLTHYFQVFAMRDGDTWLDWQTVLELANLLDLPTAPVLEWRTFELSEIQLIIQKRLNAGSVYGGACEGVIFRCANSFSEQDFKYNVLKYVRADHVQTDIHWTRNWRRALLWHEKLAIAQSANQLAGTRTNTLGGSDATLSAG